MFFISFSKILPLDENFFEVKLFQILQNQYKFSMILFRITENWRFDMILLFLKWFCFIENLIEWQNSQKAYKKQTLVIFPKILRFLDCGRGTRWCLFCKFSIMSLNWIHLSELNKKNSHQSNLLKSFEVIFTVPLVPVNISEENLIKLK